uniref:fasciclin-like arabinogalactan protein 14 n=1 Tax=Fragaria vesca subsp. vesca TaxID=101020 RepID=UPI0005C9CD87|nr:PREDICTED: fasciclin-like arabinogalactan protein 14 [Fragaria vesca subsp. vesca]
METNKPKASVSFFLVMMLLSISSCSAFNITKLLEKEDDFSTFNQHLSDTKLADQINKRSTITVLAVDNSAIGGLGDDSVVKAIMSVHVILDYYDKEKLTKLAKNNKSATLTTLYQTSGLAKNEQGFVRIATDDDGITFGSASKGSQMNSKLVKSVTSQPYNISVLQVSSIIEVPNINADPSPEKAPAPKSRKAKPPSPASSDDSADSPSDDTADSPTDDPDMDDNAPSPAKHHTPPKPKDVDSDSPSSSPAPGPAAGDGAGKSDARANAAEMGVGVVALGLVSVLVAFF